MKVQVTFDEKGISVWPIDTILKYDKEWFDTDCKVRGTNGLQDADAIDRMIGRDLIYGERIVLEVSEILDWEEETEKTLSESHYWEGKKEIEYTSYFIRYPNGQPKYQIHSADRTTGESSGKWVCCYNQLEIPELDTNHNILEGYMGLKDGQIVFCGGNGIFNAIGLPSIAEFESLEGAMYVCDLHNENPNNSRKYDVKKEIK